MGEMIDRADDACFGSEAEGWAVGSGGDARAGDGGLSGVWTLSREALSY